MSSSSASSNALTSCGHSFTRSQRPTSACASEVVAVVASVDEAGPLPTPRWVPSRSLHILPQPGTSRRRRSPLWAQHGRVLRLFRPADKSLGDSFARTPAAKEFGERCAGKAVRWNGDEKS
jgi:hypothetical protein